MSKLYKVNEIFFSVQAEGFHAGRPAVFVRFSGCNLSCPFCDTNHEPFTEMSRGQIEERVLALDPTGFAIVVFTGGEPAMQLEQDERLCTNRYLAMETNGTLPVPTWVDHVTISPKNKLSSDQLLCASELKFLYGLFDEDYLTKTGAFAHKHGIRCYIQPTADEAGRFDAIPAIEFAKKNPLWRLSVQYHKLINIQ